MRLLMTVALLLGAAPAVHAEPPERLDERGVTLPRADNLPRRSYAWSTWTSGSDDVHVLVSEGERSDLPARYQAFDNQGAALWTADHACPSFDDYTTLFEVDGTPAGARAQPGSGRIVCKWKKQIVAVDLKTGKEAWRFSDPSPMYITAGAQDRVAVSIDNRELAVLDARDGREVMRIDVQGAVLEAVAATKDGPVALLVWDTPGVVKDTIELAVGEGGALERVELSGDDPNRKLVALPIGGPAKKGLVAMKPLWAAPFGGYSFEVTPTAGAVIGVPREGVRAAWDMADGELLWERPMSDGEMFIFGEDGAAFARAGKGGDYTWGAMDPKTLKALWEKPLGPGVKPIVGGQGGGDLGLVTSAGFMLVRFKDGRERTSMPIAQGLELSNIRSTPKSLMWVTSRDTERWLYFKPLPPL